jgi:hypothetical protein
MPERAPQAAHQGPPPDAPLKLAHRRMEPQAALQPARSPGVLLALVRAAESE